MSPQKTKTEHTLLRSLKDQKELSRFRRKSRWAASPSYYWARRYESLVPLSSLLLAVVSSLVLLSL